MENRLLVPFGSLDAYVASGGGKGLERARSLGADAVVELISRSGLRGRGGAGFPTGTKWGSVLSAGGDRYVVCNAAEGEPATFKDRQLMRRNPYAVIEGTAIAAVTIGARRAYVGMKETFTLEAERLEGATTELRDAGALEGVDIELVLGPDRYLFGEETGLLGVIDGRGPFPREVRPFMQGVRGSPSSPHPTLVNNAETLANVPAIVTEGPDWFRSVGTADSPGTMLFTVAGDVAHEGVFELELGTPLLDLIDGAAGGTRQEIKAVLPGASSAFIRPDMLDMPLDFDVFRRSGTGLGAGGFAVYDESACMVEVARLFTRFLHVESCAQCPACKLGSGAINEIITSLSEGQGSVGDLEEVLARADTVTDGQKCALPTGTKLLVLSLLQAFADEFAAHASRECPLPREIEFPKLVDYDEDAGTFMYDRLYETVSAQWTEGPVPARGVEA